MISPTDDSTDSERDEASDDEIHDVALAVETSGQSPHGHEVTSPPSDDDQGETIRIVTEAVEHGEPARPSLPGEPAGRIGRPPRRPPAAIRRSPRSNRQNRRPHDECRRPRRRSCRRQSGPTPRSGYAPTSRPASAVNLATGSAGPRHRPVRLTGRRDDGRGTLRDHMPAGERPIVDRVEWVSP